MQKASFDKWQVEKYETFLLTSRKKREIHICKLISFLHCVQNETQKILNKNVIKMFVSAILVIYVVSLSDVFLWYVAEITVHNRNHWLINHSFWLNSLFKITNNKFSWINYVKLKRNKREKFSKTNWTVQFVT